MFNFLKKHQEWFPTVPVTVIRNKEDHAQSLLHLSSLIAAIDYFEKKVLNNDIVSHADIMLPFDFPSSEAFDFYQKERRERKEKELKELVKETLGEKIEQLRVIFPRVFHTPETCDNAVPEEDVKCTTTCYDRAQRQLMTYVRLIVLRESRRH